MEYEYEIPIDLVLLAYDAWMRQWAADQDEPEEM